MSEIEISIVTGTYNRLSHVQKMVESVRRSIGVGIPYEVVLVDGGSTDGTIEWAKTQPDITIIEQGELLGAIKAFNPGLYAAKGRYCVVGNDDIEYYDESLLSALSFMHDNPTVGVGCFYQDRDHPGRFDLSYMPAVLNNQQVQHIYGQVCIVPKWLGDDVGWWGDYPDMRTYGGDNNLSAFVLERGYGVTGVPCACIHDMKAVDGLRKINNDDRVRMYPGGPGHPDSVAWGKHWTHRDGSCGPIISQEPYKTNPLERKTRILYAPIYEQGHAIQKQSKHGLRDALAQYGLVYEYDYMEIASKQGGLYMRNYMRDLIDAWKPDILLTQIHSPDANLFDANSVYEIHREYPDLTWVNWNGDYHPNDLFSNGNIEMAKRFDLQCVVTTDVRSKYSQHGINWMYWQIGWEQADAQPNGSTPKHDVVFLANGYSQERYALGRMLRSLECDVGIYGSWGRGIRSNGSNLYDFNAGAVLYRNAKISIGDDQWKATGFVSNRLFQAMMAGDNGTVYMQQRVPGLEELLGMEDGVHYIAWDTTIDLRNKIDHWLSPEQDAARISIGKNGAALMVERHSFDMRVQELMEVL
jgi:glycosyltransferase involved in cell wall biosynthesis